MEIKRPLSSGIDQNLTISQTDSKSFTPSGNAQIQKGVGAVKDAFEAVRPEPSNAMVSNTSQLGTIKPQSGAVKEQMTSYMGSLAGQNEPGGLFGVMSEYLKMMQKDAGQDKKVSFPFEDKAELKEKEGKLNWEKDKIFQTIEESRNRYDKAPMPLDASLEYVLSSAGRLIKGDLGNDIDSMSKRLNELKESAAEIKHKLENKSENDDDRNNIVTRYQSIVSWIKDREDD